ncbi:MAG TPA: DNA polymerase [bacterium]|nr:DNA polymerase [bacterium]
MIARFPARELPHRYARTEDEAVAMLEHLATRPDLVADYETTGLKWHRADFRPFYVSFCDGENGWGVRLPADPDSRTHTALRRLMAMGDRRHIYHNAKFDLHAGRRHRIEDLGEVHDTLLMSHLVDENRRHTLDSLGKDWLEGDVKKMSEAVDAWFAEHNMGSPDKRRYDALPDELLEPYAVQDSVVAWWLWKGLEPLVRKEFAGIYEIERAALLELMEVESWGYKLDMDVLKRLGPSLKSSAEGTEERIRQAVKHETGKDLDEILEQPTNGHEPQGSLDFGAYDTRGTGKRRFNLASQEDLARLFFSTLGIPREGLALTDNGVTSLGKYSLQKINHPVAKMIEEWRTAVKTAGSFVDNLQSLVDRDGVLHCDFQQVGTVTGRMSCQEPNLQNLPKDGEVRLGFVPRPGCRLWFFDYSQIELRILAHYSQDPVMLEAFRNRRDLHRETAAVLFNKGASEVTDKDRDIAKKINFTIVYGGGAGSIASQLNMGKDAAKAVLNQFFEKFPAVKRFRDVATRKAEQRGWVMTHWGRKRHFPLRADLIRTGRKDKSGRRMVRWAPGHPSAGTEIPEPKWYTAVNGIVSGTATGDLCKETLRRIGPRKGILRGTGAHIVSIVHDEYQVEIPVEKEDTLVPAIKGAMEDYQFSVPISVDVAVSDGAWKDKHKVEVPVGAR